MKWAGDITPRKNFGEDGRFCLEVNEGLANWLASLALQVMLKEHDSAGRDSFQFV